MSENQELINILRFACKLAGGKTDIAAIENARQSGTIMRLATRLSAYAELRHLGGVYGPGTAFHLAGRMYYPNLSFLTLSRIPPEGEPEKAWTIAPDLIVEVSPAAEMDNGLLTQLADYFAADVRQVWIVLLESHKVRMYRSLTNFVELQEAEDLINLEVLPGFRCRVSDLFFHGRYASGNG